MAKQELKSFIGVRFGKLVVVEELPTIIQPAGGRCRLFRCLCDCGNYKDVRFTNLIQGGTTSCGCARYNRYGLFNASKNPKWKRLYTIFVDMHKRCENPKCSEYRNYGKRGISVCGEWDNFGNFREWAISNGYSEDLEIDRIDNNGDYTPENCRWATRKEQMRNRRLTIKFKHNGIEKPLVDWAEEFGLHPGTIRSRLQRHPNASSEFILRPTSRK